MVQNDGRIVAAGGPPVTREEFDRVFESVRAWGRWERPERGALNLLGPDRVAAAAQLVRTGEVVGMALPWNTVPGPDNTKPALHLMSDLGDVEAPEPSTHKDFIAVDYHGKAVSHLDALAHIAYRNQLFDGHTASDVIGSAGARFGSVDQLGPIVTRGVLLDVAAARGVDWLEPGEAVLSDDLLDTEDRLGVRVQQGDAVLLRTGHFQRRRRLGAWDPSQASAGLHVHAIPLLAERGIALLGGDGDSDVRPSPVPGVHSPVHALAITAMGVPLLDNLDLEDLSVACARAGRYEFLLVVAPLNIPGGTGCPVNPVAVL